MKTSGLIIASLLCSAMAMQAQEYAPTDSLSTDSLDRFVNLGELTVTGASVINKSDRKLIMPSGEIKRLAANGTDLVKKMQLPGVRVDAMTGAIALQNEGKLVLCINGRPVKSENVKAIDPTMVERVEYHDNPSLRYGDAELVLDFIVKVPKTGGRFGVEAQTVFTHGLECRLNPTFEINYKKSTFSLNFRDELMRGFKTWRENEEYYTLADGTKFSRIEDGQPGAMDQGNIWGGMEYMYYDPGKDLFSAELSFFGMNTPHRDYEGLLHSTLDDTTVKVSDLNKNSETYPSLNLYYQHNFSKDKMLMVNVRNTIGRSHSKRTYCEQDYTESRAGGMLSDVVNEINSNGVYTYIEANYEQQWKNDRMTLGGTINYSWDKNRYLSYGTTERMRSNTNTVFAEWWHRYGKKFDMTLGARVEHQKYELLKSVSRADWLFAPTLRMRYRIDDHNTLRANYMLRGVTPNISQVSAVRQQVDGMQYTEGSRGLSVYNMHAAQLTYEYTRNRFYGQLRAKYAYADKPIGIEKRWVDGVALSTYAHQRDAQTLNLGLQFRYEVLPEWLTASAGVEFSRFMTHGNSYNHCLNDVPWTMSLTAMHWNWMLEVDYATSRRRLDGEMVDQMKAVGLAVILSYKYRNFNFVAICLNPFTGDYKLESSNRNAIAGYKRYNHMDFLSQCLVLQVHYNISWGRKYENGNRKINNGIERSTTTAAGK
ncbi:MAG: TonB-dependent receptor plug domain-containing protein [Muribaculaceae bacterium]